MLARQTPIALAALLLLLSCRTWDNPYDPQNRPPNQPPYDPAGPLPANRAGDQDTGLVLSWTGGDPDSADTVTYDIYFGTTDEPALVQQALDSTAYDPAGLLFSTEYFWKVVARDAGGDTSAGPVWSFTTLDSSTNHPPSTPSEPAPDSAATGRSTAPVLSWTGGDPDPDDTVLYDVHFGTSVSPPLVAQGLAQATYEPGTLDFNTQYYWYVVARDNHSAVTQGPLWQFRTMGEIVITSPTAATQWRVGTNQRIEWTGGVGDGPERPAAGVSVGLSRSGKPVRQGRPCRASLFAAPDSMVVFFSTDNGGTWIRHGRATTPGQYDWTVPSPPTEFARVQVRIHADGNVEQGTSPTYRVTDTLPPSPIAVTSPAAGVRWEISSTYQVTWTGGTDGVDSTAIYYSTNNGTIWTRQGAALVPGEFSWEVPAPATQQALIEVRAYNMNRTTTGTSGLFEVTEPRYPDSLIATVRVGSKPRALCWSKTANKVYVANRDADSVSVIGEPASQVVATIAVGEVPGVLVWNELHNAVYCANEGGGSVAVIDCATDSVRATVNVGIGPRDMVLDTGHDKLYVVNYTSNSVSVIDCAADSVVATIPVGSRPSAICWLPQYGKVFTANRSSGDVSVIDCLIDSVIATVVVGSGPCATVADIDRGEVYVANQTSNSVSVIRGDNHSVIQTITGLSGPVALCHSRTDSQVYAADLNIPNVSVISTVTHEVTVNVEVGSEPRTVMWAPVVDAVYVANYVDNNLMIIEGATNHNARTIGVGQKPTALCWNATDRRVYVANLDGDAVSVIGLSAPK